MAEFAVSDKAVTDLASAIEETAKIEEDIENVSEFSSTPQIKILNREHCLLPDSEQNPVIYVNYEDERLLPQIQSLVAGDLSEPYSVFTYRYFLHNWPGLCICAFSKFEDGKGNFNDMVGTIVCKAEADADCCRGYIAMLAVSTSQRNKGIGSKLVKIGIQRMMRMGCDEIVLETEVINIHYALKLSIILLFKIGI